MSDKEIYERLKQLQNSLLEIDECIGQLIAQIQNEESTQGSYVMERSLSVVPNMASQRAKPSASAG